MTIVDFNKKLNKKAKAKIQGNSLFIEHKDKMDYKIVFDINVANDSLKNIYNNLNQEYKFLFRPAGSL